MIQNREQALKLLQQARQRLTPPSAWTQRTFARNAYGEDVRSTSREAVCWCSIGALNADVLAERTYHLDQANVVARATLEKFTKGRIAEFNDHHHTTHADVLAVFDKAIDHLKGTV